LIISPPLWRRHIKPRMKTIIESAKKKGVYVLYHTDGNCEPIIPDLIEIGVDILNPIQPECMDPAKIKEQYGEKLTLSGTISIQDTLPRGTVEDVRSEVKARIRTCGQGGGLIISPSNQVLLDTKVENFLAIYDAVREFGQYPLKF
jgi:uroporphyrinogen decarboxylase